MNHTRVLMFFPLFALDLIMGQMFSQGNFWQPMSSGLTNLNVGALAVDSGSALYAVAGVIVFRSTNNGISWDSAGTTGGSGSNFLEANTLGHLFAGDGFLGVFRSTNNGSSWIPINSGLTNFFIRSLAVKSTGAIFAGTMRSGIGTILYGIYRSTTNGDNWIAVNAGLRDSTGIGSLGINRNGDVFAGSSDGGGIYRSTNNGDVWTPINNGLPLGLTITSIAVSPNDNVFAGTLYSPSGTQDTIIYRSTDNGDTWTPVYIGPPILSHVLSLAINRDGHIFAAIGQSTAGTGVARSTDEGGSWTFTNSGLPMNPNITDLIITHAGYIFASVHGYGIFRSVQTTTSVVQTGSDIPLSYSLRQNYPNPFNPSTVIGYELPTWGHVTLSVFDILGHEVQRLVNTTQPAGTYTVEFVPTGLASGVYMYRIRTGQFVQARKLLFLR